MMRPSPGTALVAVTFALAVTAGCGGARVDVSEVPVRARPAEPTAPRADVPSAATAPDPVPVEIPLEHVVAPGETLWRIARNHGVALDELARANGIDDPTRIESGRRLVIPGRGTAATTPSAGPDPGSWLWPVPGGQVLSRFGAPRRTHTHTGVDIDGEAGQPVLAARAGTITFRGSMRGYGKTVIIDHGDGITTLYAHNSDVLVRTGDAVQAGARIARVGRTGNASGDHVHFEVRVHGGAVDPLRLVGEPAAGPRS